MASERTQPLVAAISGDMAADREEERWIERARRGDAAAIDWLLARYRSRVVRLATHVLRHSGEAEDVAQEAFVRAFRSLRTYRAEGRFYTWLYQIVVRVCLDRRRQPYWDRDRPIETLSGTEAERDRSMDAVERRMLVESLLDQLTPPMRAILVLRELEGLNYE